MQKDNINDLLLKQALGTLSDREKAQLIAWLNENPQHRQQADALLNERDASKRLQSMEDTDEQAAWEAFRQIHFSRPRKPLYYYIRYALATAAVAALLFGLSRMLWKEEHQPKAPHLSKLERTVIEQSLQSGKTGAVLILPNRPALKLTPQMQQQLVAGEPMPKEFFEGDATVKTLAGKEFWLALEDGTRVHLNYNTTLKYPGHFADDNRTVYLEGEAYFIVNHEADRPFYVETANGTVKEYGTSFNVNTTAEKGVTEVVLVEGSVSIMPTKTSEYKMKQGQIARLVNGSENVTVINDDIAPYISWNTGQYVFDACPMSKLMKVLSCWYDKQVVFENEKEKNTLFSGSIDRYKDLRATLDAIEFVTNSQIRITETSIIIK